MIGSCKTDKQPIIFYYFLKKKIYILLHKIIVKIDII